MDNVKIFLMDDVNYQIDYVKIYEMDNVKETKFLNYIFLNII